MSERSRRRRGTRMPGWWRNDDARSLVRIALPTGTPDGLRRDGLTAQLPGYTTARVELTDQTQIFTNNTRRREKQRRYPDSAGGRVYYRYADRLWLKVAFGERILVQQTGKYLGGRRTGTVLPRVPGGAGHQPKPLHGR